ncbi:ABC-type nickel/cobalt efflux system, permease component RcnA [Ectothiorhodospira magna]|uniref:Nickel/cobalt efflux system n=1 Tax=Ectothiorhodospira magna TaxID=867345 RepID=A0A1H9BQG0_9GAMM|nr:nickel/cobalt transporter [Ectothiorhodospira magna]SEP90931.1 ABC-type nickel/cobalt efflux system, permease component RcnA [Ectothiorhodospira magna]
MHRLIILCLLIWLLPLQIHASALTGGAPPPAAPHQPLMLFEDDPPAEASLGDRLVAWVITQQRQLHRQLADGMQQVRENPGPASAGALILVSFLYGIFHAAGPGHGKAVITTYLLTHRQHLRRALSLSFASAMLQGITAIALVSGVLLIAGMAAREAMGQAYLLEQISFALVALLGVWLSLRAIRGYLRLYRTPAPAPVQWQPVTAVQGGGHGLRPALPQDVTHPHGPGCGCGHPHHVTPQQAAEAGSLSAMIATIVAVGIRPCTGAILVLVAAHLLGLWLAGIFAVLAMSLGTAITVSVLAILAVKARHLAVRLAGGGEYRIMAWVGQTVTLMGGLLILGLGLLLLAGSLGSAGRHPLGL